MKKLNGPQRWSLPFRKSKLDKREGEYQQAKKAAMKREVTAWIGIIGTIVGALLAGGATWLNAHFQLRRQEERDKRKHILSKLEELYETITEFKRHHKQNSFRIMMKVAGRETDLSDTPDVDNPRSPIERVEMLVGFYAPELQPLIDQLRKSLYEHGDVVGRSIQLEERTDDATMAILADFRDKAPIVTKICQEIQTI